MFYGTCWSRPVSETTPIDVTQYYDVLQKVTQVLAEN